MLKKKRRFNSKWIRIPNIKIKLELKFGIKFQIYLEFKYNSNWATDRTITACKMTRALSSSQISTHYSINNLINKIFLNKWTIFSLLSSQPNISTKTCNKKIYLIKN